MSNLTLTKAGFDSSSETNGVNNDSLVFYYPLGNNSFVDKSNEDFIKVAIGCAEDEEDFQNALNFSGDNNKFLTAKFNEVKRMNLELASFFLVRLNNLYWRSPPINNKGVLTIDNLNNRGIKSSSNIQEIIDMLIPLINNLRVVFRKELDKKYPNVLLARGLQYEVNKKKLDVSNSLGQDLEKKTKKSKKKL